MVATRRPRCRWPKRQCVTKKEVKTSVKLIYNREVDAAKFSKAKAVSFVPFVKLTLQQMYTLWMRGLGDWNRTSQPPLSYWYAQHLFENMTEYHIWYGITPGMRTKHTYCLSKWDEARVRDYMIIKQNETVRSQNPQLIGLSLENNAPPH